MSMDISERTSAACDSCKRKKAKCTGTSPCAHCSEHNITCSYLKSSRKRGPVKKMRKDEGWIVNKATSPSLLAEVLNSEVERTLMIDIFLDYLAPGYLPPGQATRDRLVNPRTKPENMIALSAMAYVCRTNGNFERAEQYAVTARGFGRDLIDEKTADAAAGYMALASYFPKEDHRQLMYSALAYDISKSLRRETVSEARAYYFSYMTYALSNTSLDLPTKRQTLLSHIPKMMALEDATRNDVLVALSIRLICTLLPKAASIFFRSFIAIKTIEFTQEELDNILTDAYTLDCILQQPGQIKKAEMLRLFLVKVIKTLAYWRGGDITTAKREADLASAVLFLDDFKYHASLGAMHSGILVLFYATVFELSKVQDLYDRFAIMCKCSGQLELLAAFPPFSDIFEHMAPPSSHATICETNDEENIEIITNNNPTVDSPPPLSLSNISTPLQTNSPQKDLETADIYTILRVPSTYSAPSYEIKENEIVNIPLISDVNMTSSPPVISTSLTSSDINISLVSSPSPLTSVPPPPPVMLPYPVSPSFELIPPYEEPWQADNSTADGRFSFLEELLMSE